MDDRLLQLEHRLDKAIITIEKHNFLLENITVNREQHATEHQFLRELVEREKSMNEIRKRVLTNLITAGGVAFIVALVTALGVMFKDWLSGI